MILSILILCIFFIFTTIVLVLLHHFFRVKKQSVSNNDLVYDDDLDVIETEQETSEHSKMRAVVFCSPDRTFSAKRFNYKGQKDCNLFKMLYETENGCTWGCIGFGTCVSHCPQDAIVIKNNTAVVTEACNGCGKCLSYCPNNIIKMIPTRTDFVVQCSSHDKTDTTCSRACTACAKCTSPYAPTGFSVKNNLAVTDYSINHDRALAASRCPTKCIKKVTLPEEKSFTFWKLCYNIFHKDKEDGDQDIWE